MKTMFSFYPPPTNLTYKNSQLMQLHLIFHKGLIKTNWKSGNFKVLVDFPVFQQLKKLWTEGGGKFILFLWLFLSVHITFQYKLKFHTILVMVTFYFLLLLCYFFLICSSTVLFREFFIINLISMCKWVFSLAVPSFVSNFNSRKSKQLASKITRKNIFHLKSKLSQVSVIALSD